MKTPILCVALVISCGKPDQAQPPGAAAQAQPAAPPAAATAAPSKTIGTADAAAHDDQLTIGPAGAALARFKKNQIINCTMDAVTIKAPTGYKPDPAVTLGIGQIAKLLLNDGNVALNDPRSAALLSSTSRESRSFISKMLLVLAVGAKQVDASLEVKYAEITTKIADVRQSIDNAKQADGEVAMPSCNIPDHTILGTCVIEDTLTASRKASITWRVARSYFDVSTTVDSDASMLGCLQLGGKWTAPPKNAPAVVQERLHQHARQLRELAGQ